MMLGRLYYNYFPTFLLRHGYKLQRRKSTFKGCMRSSPMFFSVFSPNVFLERIAYPPWSSTANCTWTNLKNPKMKLWNESSSNHPHIQVFLLLYFLGGEGIPWMRYNLSKWDTNPSKPNLTPDFSLIFLEGMKHLLYFPMFFRPPRLGLKILKSLCHSNCFNKIQATWPGKSARHAKAPINQQSPKPPCFTSSVSVPCRELFGQQTSTMTLRGVMDDQTPQQKRRDDVFRRKSSNVTIVLHFVNEPPVI